MRALSASIAASLSLVASVASAQDVPIESLVARCHAGEVVACTAAGARYQLGRGVAQDPSLSADLYTRACDGGAMLACGLLGALYADGRGTTRDEARAVTLFRRACDGGHEHSCGQLGLMMVAGRGTARDIPGAATPLERGCAANHYGACEVLGRMNVRGIGVARDPARGQSLMQRACAGGAQTACTPDTGGTDFAAPPPVTGAQTYDAPPPVTYAAPPSVNVRPPPPRVVVSSPPPPPRVVYVPRPYVRPSTPEPVSSSASSVSFLGGEHRASSYYLGGEFGVVRSDSAARSTFFLTGFRHSRGPIEFMIDGRFGGGTFSDELQRQNPRARANWSTLALGAGLGLNILSWPRADRERFSLINLSAGVNAAYGFGIDDPGSAFRFGGYVANTLYFLCWMGVRTEFTGAIAGADTWGHTFSASLFFGGRPSYQCR